MESGDLSKRSPREWHIRKWAAQIAVGSLLTGFVAAPSAQARAADFTVLDNTAYADVALGPGTIKTNFIPARYCQPLTYDSSTGATKLPSKEDWQALIEKYDPTASDSPGYLVLDCEKLYNKGDAKANSQHFQILRQLQQWAREIRPNRLLGWYGLSNHTNISSADRADAETAVAAMMDLDGGHTAYFPSAYILANGTSPYAPGVAWQTALHADVAEIRTVDQQSQTGPHPVFPYIWPQYYNKNTELISGANWTQMLDFIRADGFSGTIIWGGQNPAVAYNAANDGAGDWVQATQAFVASLDR